VYAIHLPQSADRRLALDPATAIGDFEIGGRMMGCPADASRTQALEVRRKARNAEQHERAECGASHADICRDLIFVEIL
jgi:hypothetical protein